jgi:Coenzyme PQQ synthesis protein D (PqqD)
VLKIPDSIQSTHNRDGGTVLDIRHGRMFRLNPVGSRILDLLGRGYDQTGITDEISREFKAAREIVEPNVREFLLLLEKHGLLE